MTGETTNTTEYANWKSGGVESAVTLWVRLPPRSIRLTAKVQSPGSKIQGQRTKDSGSRVRFVFPTLDLGLWTLQPGLLVKGEDAWLATRKSGFDSPAVHLSAFALFSPLPLAGEGLGGRGLRR